MGNELSFRFFPKETCTYTAAAADGRRKEVNAMQIFKEPNKLQQSTWQCMLGFENRTRAGEVYIAPFML